MKLLSGGRGGLGNEHFKGSKNTTPKESTKGVVGEDGDFLLKWSLWWTPVSPDFRMPANLRS